jgi:RNA polymerase sigma-70 factor (ECF subfamily)
MTEMETQMIQAALQGQAQGYRFLMNRYGRQVQLFVAQWVTDMRDVEELTQDVFVRAFEHLSDYDPQRASFSTWLSCIAHNIALNHLRNQGYVPLPLNEEQYSPPDVPEWAQDETANEAERLTLLDKAIDSLRPEERSLLHLRYYEGHSLGEIAEVMEVQAGPLANRLQRIRQKLSKLIGI